MIKNKCAPLGQGTLKSAGTENDMISWVNFLCVDTNSEKLKETLIIIRWACSKMGLAF